MTALTENLESQGALGITEERHRAIFNPASTLSHFAPCD
jgi:hypothetical protein